MTKKKWIKADASFTALKLVNETNLLIKIAGNQADASFIGCFLMLNIENHFVISLRGIAAGQNVNYLIDLILQSLVAN